MYEIKPEWEVGRWYWDGACIPEPGKVLMFETFSIGIFQVQLKASGTGYKRGKILCRIIGYNKRKEEVFRKADEICRSLNSRQDYPQNIPKEIDLAAKYRRSLK